MPTTILAFTICLLGINVLYASLSMHFTPRQGVCNKEIPFISKARRSVLQCLAYCLQQKKCFFAEWKTVSGDRHICNLFSNTSSDEHFVKDSSCSQYMKKDISGLGTMNNTHTNVENKKPQHVQDCHSLWEAGERKSGVYELQLENSVTVSVYCEMGSTSGWTVFHKRYDGEKDFDRTWNKYVGGFGPVSVEHWLGFKHMLAIMNQRSEHQLRVEMVRYNGEKGFAEYNFFNIIDDGYYTLNVSGYSGNAGNSLDEHNLMRFSTKDNDNDPSAITNCADDYEGGWWYGDRCVNKANLNGDHKSSARRNAKTMTWLDFTDGYESLKKAQMMFR